jgi:[ribosomal protein S18]-alanine N-acetyltransferase
MGVTTIRKMTETDLAAVVALEAESQPKPWSEKVFRDELGADNRTYLVVGEPINAFGGVMVVGEEAHVTNLLVASEWRRQGLGRALLVALIEAAVRNGAKHLTLEVRAGNLEARSLYASVGMAPVGVRRNYYGDDDAIIMWAHDIDAEDFLGSLT